jgi:hypothetical protein
MLCEARGSAKRLAKSTTGTSGGSRSPLPGPDMEKLITARLAKPTSIVEADVLHRLFGPAIIGSLAHGGHRAELKTWLP